MTPDEEFGYWLFASGVVILYCAAVWPRLLGALREKWFYLYRVGRGGMVVGACCMIALGAAKLGVVPKSWFGLLAVLGVTAMIVAAIVDLPDDPPRKTRRRR